MRGSPIALYVLDVATRGSLAGYLGTRPIAETVIDRHGRRYRYAGLAPRRRDGVYDIESLGPDEWIVEPGLLYRGEDSKRH